MHCLSLVTSDNILLALSASSVVCFLNTALLLLLVYDVIVAIEMFAQI